LCTPARPLVRSRCAPSQTATTRRAAPSCPSRLPRSRPLLKSSGRGPPAKACRAATPPSARFPTQAPARSASAAPCARRRRVARTKSRPTSLLWRGHASSGPRRRGVPSMSKPRWAVERLRPAGSPVASFSARSCSRRLPKLRPACPRPICSCRARPCTRLGLPFHTSRLPFTFSDDEVEDEDDLVVLPSSSPSTFRDDAESAAEFDPFVLAGSSLGSEKPTKLDAPEEHQHFFADVGSEMAPSSESMPANSKRKPAAGTAGPSGPSGPSGPATKAAKAAKATHVDHACSCLCSAFLNLDVCVLTAGRCAGGTSVV
jgi:hypothetical protein